LAPDVEVCSYREPATAEGRTAHHAPSTFIFDAQAGRPDWIDHAAVLLNRFPCTPALMLVDAAKALEARFVMGERCSVLQRSFRLAALLDVVCTTLPHLPRRRPWRDPRIAEAIELIAREHAELNLNALAERLNVSSSYLSRTFHRQVGVSLRAYVTRVRVYAARHLLEQGPMKLDAVAHAVGFHDASHLSRIFVEITGRRPGQHRSRRPHGR
jgi:transcriptional regulator GlxA family with amidase domain